MLAAIAILILSTLDGMLTVHHMNLGAAEINPMLAALVKNDPAQFAIAKWIMTSIGVIILIISARARLFGSFRSESVLYGVLVGYSCIVCYSLLLAVIY